MQRVVRFVARAAVFRVASAVVLTVLFTFAACSQTSGETHLAAVPQVVTSSASLPPSDWRVYGHDAGGTRYSPLAQITPRNVGQLKVAWVFHTGDFTHTPRELLRSYAAYGRWHALFGLPFVNMQLVDSLVFFCVV